MQVDDMSKLATLIRKDREPLLTTWREQVRQMPSARKLDTPTLNDHIPQLIEELATALESKEEQSIPEAMRQGTPPAHGQQRVQDGFDIEEVVAEGSRKQFSITAAGSANLAENHATVEQLLERLGRLGSDGETADHTPIARALENLNSVLRHRLSREGTSVNSIHDAAALIDEAAQKIERM